MKKIVICITLILSVLFTASGQFHVRTGLEMGYTPEIQNGYVSFNTEGFYSIHKFDLGLGVGIGTTMKDGKESPYETYNRTHFIPLYVHTQYNLPFANLFVNMDMGYNFSFGEKAYEVDVMPVETLDYERQMMYVGAADYNKGLNESRNGFFLKIGFGFCPIEHLDINFYAGLSTWNKCSILNVSKLNEDGTPVYVLDGNGEKILLLDEDGCPQYYQNGYSYNINTCLYWKDVIRDYEIANNPNISEDDMWVNQLPTEGWESLVYDYVVNILGYGADLKGDPKYGEKGLYDPVYQVKYKTETEKRIYSRKLADNNHFAQGNPLRYFKIEFGVSLKYHF